MLSTPPKFPEARSDNTLSPLPGSVPLLPHSLPVITLADQRNAANKRGTVQIRVIELIKTCRVAEVDSAAAD